MRWVAVDRAEYAAMKKGGYRVRKTVFRKGPKGTIFQAEASDLRKFYARRIPA